MRSSLAEAPRKLCELVLSSALYGFAIGTQHSVRFACTNMVKFPLLIIVTALLCSLGFYVCCQFVSRDLRFGRVLMLAIDTYRDSALLLASLAPVAIFLGGTIVLPDTHGLGEYPLFLGLNVAFIAAAGTIALGRQGVALLRDHRLEPARVAQVLFAWLALALFAGGQCAWYLRSFFCPASITNPPLIEGTRPDYRGATSFYEAVYHLVDPPPLPDEYHRWR